MFLGKIIGTVVASQKEATLDGLKFLVVRRPLVMAMTQTATSLQQTRSALESMKSSWWRPAVPRQTRLTDKRPCDAGHYGDCRHAGS